MLKHVHSHTCKYYLIDCNQNKRANVWNTQSYVQIYSPLNRAKVHMQGNFFWGGGGDWTQPMIRRVSNMQSHLKLLTNMAWAAQRSASKGQRQEFKVIIRIQCKTVGMGSLKFDAHNRLQFTYTIHISCTHQATHICTHSRHTHTLQDACNYVCCSISEFLWNPRKILGKS